MRCKVGDLAIVVDAQLPSNLGNIVRVVAPHDGKGELVFDNEGPVWIVECQQPMTWAWRRRFYRARIGPVPDHRLQPIRGNAPAQQVAKGRTHQDHQGCDSGGQAGRAPRRTRITEPADA